MNNNLTSSFGDVNEVPFGTHVTQLRFFTILLKSVLNVVSQTKYSRRIGNRGRQIYFRWKYATGSI